PEQRHAVVACALQPGIYRGTEAVPAGQHDARSRPAKYPRDRAQVLDLPAGLARRRPAADVELRYLADRSRGAEIVDKARGLVDQLAERAVCFPAQLLHDLAVGVEVIPGARAFQKCRLERRGDERFEVAAPDLRVGVLAGDDLALLGDADA